MDRRTVIRAVGVGIVAATAGCMGGEVVHEVQRQLRIEPGGYWVSQIPAVDGSGAISYTARAEARFDVYVFTARAAFEAYEAYHENGEAERTPTGHGKLSTTAVFDEERERYGASTDDDGARQPFEAETESYFVVDHSSYGMGAEPGDRATTLNVFVDLQIVEKRLAI